MKNESNEKLIANFYSAFEHLDAERMIACYHDEVIFEDPAFGELRGHRARNMWRMLCESQKGKDFKVSYSDISADEEKGTAHWEARYTFSKTGRNVHNKIEARFEFSDGKIIKHYDEFDLHRWAGQAMGFKGKLIGGTGFFKKKLQAQTNAMLSKYESR